jgi:hypothetical protein
MVTLLRDHVAVTRQAPFEALAAASHPRKERITQREKEWAGSLA